MSCGLNKTFWNSEIRAVHSSFLAKERKKERKKGGKVRKKDQGKRRGGRGRKGENRN